MRAIFFSLLVALPALAGSTYLNGVRIDGVTNQKFDKVNVRIDEQGNVLIEAPGYNVRQVEGTPADKPKPAGVLTKRYYLVTEQTVAGMTEFDIDVYVNSKFYKKLRNGDEQLVADLTKTLTPGQNSILFVAKKLPVASRKSMSREHVFRIVIGEGTTSGDQVLIENPVVKFERTAADPSDHTQEFMLTTR